MKTIVSVILVLTAVFFSYLLYLNIKEPIKFGEIKNERHEQVVTKLEDIRTAQEIFRDVTGKFAKDFDTLFHVLKNDSIAIEKILGDPDDPTGQEFVRTVIMRSAMDSLNVLGVKLNELEKILYDWRSPLFIDKA